MNYINFSHNFKLQNLSIVKPGVYICCETNIFLPPFPLQNNIFSPNPELTKQVYFTGFWSPCKLPFPLPFFLFPLPLPFPLLPFFLHFFPKPNESSYFGAVGSKSRKIYNLELFLSTNLCNLYILSVYLTLS